MFDNVHSALSETLQCVKQQGVSSDLVPCQSQPIKIVNLYLNGTISKTMDKKLLQWMQFLNGSALNPKTMCDEILQAQYDCVFQFLQMHRKILHAISETVFVNEEQEAYESLELIKQHGTKSYSSVKKAMRALQKRYKKKLARVTKQHQKEIDKYQNDIDKYQNDIDKYQNELARKDEVIARLKVKRHISIKKRIFGQSVLGKRKQARQNAKPAKKMRPN